LIRVGRAEVSLGDADFLVELLVVDALSFVLLLDDLPAAEPTAAPIIPPTIAPTGPTTAPTAAPAATPAREAAARTSP
jgi:hypothetical protein